QVSTVTYRQIDTLLQDGEGPEELRTVVIPMTAKETHTLLQQYPHCEFKRGLSLTEVQRIVAAYDTLKELEPEEVEYGFWLGYTLGNIYWQAIDRARFQVQHPGEEYPQDHPSPAALTCPSFTELMTTRE